MYYELGCLYAKCRPESAVWAADFMGADTVKTVTRLILGSPAEVVEEVMSYHEEFGAEVMWFMVDWPGMDPRFTLETIERFGKEVIPEIKQRTPECPLP